MTTDNRTNEPSEAMILAALNAYSSKGLEIDGYDPVDEYPSLDMWGERFASQMRAALVAAQGAAPPVNSFDTTAERVKAWADSLHVAQQEPLGDPVFRAAAAIAETQARRQNLQPEVIQGVTREHMQDAKAALTAAGVAPQEPSQTETKSGNNFVSLDRMIAEVERAAAARARGEALIEAVQAHLDLHKTYGSTVACRGGIGGQALTSHCAEICYNADAHQKEMEAWQKLEVEAIEYSRTRAASDREEESR